MARTIHSGERIATAVESVAIIGAGRVGTALARSLAAAGLDVRVAGRGPVQNVELIVGVVAPGARAMTTADAVRGADVVVLAVPMHRWASVDAAALRGATVIDVMNYWEPIDGHLPEFAAASDGTSLVVAAALPESTVVKTFNHIGYHDIESDARPAGAPDRRALAVVGDDDNAVSRAMAVVDAAGFDAVDLGALDRGTVLESGSPLFGARHDRAAIERLRTFQS